MQPSHATLQPKEIKHKILVMSLTESSLEISRDNIRVKSIAFFKYLEVPLDFALKQ